MDTTQVVGYSSGRRSLCCCEQAQAQEWHAAAQFHPAPAQLPQQRGAPRAPPAHWQPAQQGHLSTGVSTLDLRSRAARPYEASAASAGAAPRPCHAA